MSFSKTGGKLHLSFLVLWFEIASFEWNWIVTADSIHFNLYPTQMETGLVTFSKSFFSPLSYFTQMTPWKALWDILWLLYCYQHRLILWLIQQQPMTPLNISKPIINRSTFQGPYGDYIIKQSTPHKCLMTNSKIRKLKAITSLFSFIRKGMKL